MSDKRKLHIFNPENDVALANGNDYFTPPEAARKIAYDLRLLPAWWAADDDIILADNADAQWLDRINRLRGRRISAIDWRKLARVEAVAAPWGWNHALRQRLSRYDNLSAVPSKSQVDRIRELSHRRTSASLLRAILDADSSLRCPLPVELSSEDEVMNFIARHPRCFIKSPWSNSGRGVMQVFDPDAATFRRWLRGTLARQGSVMAEIGLDKLQDFALEYHIRDGKAQFAGYSVFFNDSRNSFASALVADSKRLEAILSRYGDILRLQATVGSALESVVGSDYCGYVGVDMMVFNDDGVPRINPCVELNLRRTMGCLTALLGDSLIAEGCTARFSIEYSKQGFFPPHPAYEPRFIDNRLISGTLALTPPEAGAQYRALLQITD